MPLTHFICPDGAKIEVAECLKEGGCRMGDRCANRSYLKLVSKERDLRWRCDVCRSDCFTKPDVISGVACPKCGGEIYLVFSTTGLIRGTMESFLLLTNDYAIAPESRAFMITGTRGHKALEGATDEYSLLEERFDGYESDETGISDVIESECGKTILSDSKLSGSFKIAKCLGFKVVERPSGEVFKSGKRKGQEKTIKELVRDDQYIDRWEWTIQTNKYRIEAEKRGFEIAGRKLNKIDELRIQAIARDGGTYIARSRGVFRNVYYFKLDMLPDEEVLAYFKSKREALQTAVRQGYWSTPCDKKENWGGLKCSKFCSVAEFCSYGRYLKREKQTEDEMIKGLSEVRRLPRLGKIRLGIKKVTSTGKEYPAEIDYFRLDPKTPSELENKNLIDEFHRLYGDKPKQIKIMFPLPDPAMFFPQFYKRYAGSVLRCKGDGETAGCISREFAEGLKIIGTDLETGGVRVECKGQDCPYYTSKPKRCGESAALSVLLPELKGAGVWEIMTGSFHSIVNVNSCLEYIRAIAGRVHMIPLTLERREQAITYEGRQTKHYILHVSMDMALADLQRFALIDPTKIALQLPEPEIDKEDILFQENRDVNPTDAEVVGSAPLQQQAAAPSPAQTQPAAPAPVQPASAVAETKPSAQGDTMSTADKRLELIKRLQNNSASIDAFLVDKKLLKEGEGLPSLSDEYVEKFYNNYEPMMKAHAAWVAKQKKAQEAAAAK
jgi:hypothetical protein